MLSWIFKNCIQINSRTSNSDYSNSPLTRTKFSFPWSKFHWNLPRKLEFPALKLELFFASLQSSSYRVLLYLVATFSRPWESENERSHCHDLSQHCHSSFSPHSPTRSLKQGSDACGRGYECTSLNGLILSSKNSLFQNKAIESKTFLLKMSFSCMRI